MIFFQAVIVLIIIFFVLMFVRMAFSIYRDLMVSNFLRATEEKTFATRNGAHTFRFYVQ